MSGHNKIISPWTMAVCAKNLIFKRPILVIFDSTKLCNQRCPMCNIHKEKSEHLSVEQLDKIALELKKFGVRYVFVQGGEPLVRKDIIEIADVFIRHSIKPTIITNGVLMTPEIALQIAQRPCNLAISIDSLDKERYAYLRGSDDLERVMKNIEFLSEITERKGNWSITTTITKQSDFDDVRNIYEYARKNGFMHAIRPYISVTGTAGRPDDSLQYSCEDVLDIFEYFLKIAKKENYLAYTVYREHIRYIKGEPTSMCDAMRYSILLKETGEFAPCLEMPDKSFTLENFFESRKQYKKLFEKCNREHPCFYNDAREIGILYRNLFKLGINAPRIIAQMIKYKSFF